MELRDILEYTNTNPSTWLATVENGRPRVRGMLMWFADETGFYYHTGDKKRLCRQLMANPYVEAGFFNPGTGPDFSMVRVRGKVEFVQDKALEEKLFADRPWLHDNLRAMADKNMTVKIFRIASGEAEMWNMSVNGREMDQQPIVFGAGS